MRPLSVRARLTLYYSLAVALTTLLLLTGVYLLVRADLLRQMDTQLRGDLAAVSKVAGAEPDEVMEVAQQGSVTLFEIRRDGQPIITTPAWKRAGLTDSPRQIRHGRAYYIRTGLISTQHAQIQISVARDGESVRRTLGGLAAILLTGFACTLALALVGGYFMAGRVLAPIGAMASKAQAITADKLSERLPVHNPNDELGRLATTFNNTLARLQDSFDRLRQFTSDASHELRTPLAAMKSVGEVALRDGNDPAAHREGIGSMLEEVDRLARLTESLLKLTRADAGTVRLSKTATDLSALTSEVVECVRVLADEKGLALTAKMQTEAWVIADPAVLRQAVLNVLDNAIKYTPAGGEVRVTVSREDSHAIIEVADTGDGIPAEHRDRVFDRFYRGDAARSGEAGGVGLGLAIARWAVEANGGRIELARGDGKGSVFRIVLRTEPTSKEEMEWTEK